MMTKEEIINRIDLAIAISETHGYSETLLALKGIRWQILCLPNTTVLQSRNQPNSTLRLS